MERRAFRAAFNGLEHRDEAGGGRRGCRRWWPHRARLFGLSRKPATPRQTNRDWVTCHFDGPLAASLRRCGSPSGSSQRPQCTIHGHPMRLQHVMQVVIEYCNIIHCKFTAFPLLYLLRTYPHPNVREDQARPSILSAKSIIRMRRPRVTGMPHQVHIGSRRQSAGGKLRPRKQTSDSALC